MADNVGRYSKRLERQRTRGLQYSLDAVNSMYANLSATQRGLARTLTNENDRTLSKLAAMATRMAAQSVRSVNETSAGMVSKYGGLYGGQVAQKMDVAESLSQGIGAAGVAALQTGKGLARAGQSAMAIQQAGVAEAQAAAQYALAQASIARAQADADAVAALKARQAGDALNAAFPGITEVSNLAAQIAQQARKAITDVQKAMEEAGRTGDVPLDEVMTKVVNQLLLSSPEEVQLAQYIVRQISAAGLEKRGVGTRDDVVDIVVNAVMLSYSGDVPPSARSQVQTDVEEKLKTLYGTSTSGDGGDGDGGGAGVSPLTGKLPGRVFGPDQTPPIAPETAGQPLVERLTAAGFSESDAKKAASWLEDTPVGRNATSYPRGDAYYYAKDDEKKQLDMVSGYAAGMYSYGMSIAEIRAMLEARGYGRDALDYIMSRVNEQAKGG